MKSKGPVFITGITGNQGGAVAQQLKEKGYQIIGLTRNAQSEKAKLLQEQGVRLIEGDMANAKTYESVLIQAEAIFLVQALKDMKSEINEATQFLNSIKDIDLKHLIYSSVLGADKNTGVPHFESKGAIEQLVKASFSNYTILRPASFYENYLYPQVYKGIKKGKFVSPLNKHCRQQMIGVSHIGEIGSHVIENPEIYKGKTLEIATDEYDMVGVVEVFAEVLKMKVKYQKLPGLLTRIFMGQQLYKMFNYMNHHDFCEVKNIQNVRKEFNIQSDFRDWVMSNFKDEPQYQLTN
jgi:uncharacterized protein YbjT (DUF2867 family)